MWRISCRFLLRIEVKALKLVYERGHVENLAKYLGHFCLRGLVFEIWKNNPRRHTSYSFISLPHCGYLLLLVPDSVINLFPRCAKLLLIGGSLICGMQVDSAASEPHTRICSLLSLTPSTSDFESAGNHRRYADYFLTMPFEDFVLLLSFNHRSFHRLRSSRGLNRHHIPKISKSFLNNSFSSLLYFPWDYKSSFV